MFCGNCGKEVSDGAAFCPSCGNTIGGGVAVAATREPINDNEVKYQLKPDFNIPYKLVSHFGKGFLTVILISYCIGLNIIGLWLALPISFLITLVIIAVCIGIELIFEKLQYRKLEYNFYARKVEYVDGFLNKEQKELKYKFIREVTMRQSIIERMFNLGTIRVFTNASSGGYGYGSRHGNMNGVNGIQIHCVKDVREQYQIIKKILDDAEENE